VSLFTASVEAEVVGGMARLHPVAFTRLLKLDYRPAALHWAIADALRDVEQDKTDRLMIFVPPQHGKSALASVYFPPWYLGRHPDRRIIAASYGADLVADWGRQARNIVASDEYRLIFPDTQLAQDSQAVNHWDIAGTDGGYICAGVGGPITGRGAHVLLIDDPVKNQEEAESQIQREAVWQWYQTVAYPRLRPPGAIVLIMTRWHEDDLAGRLLKAEAEGGDKWRVLRLPAMAEEDDPLGRTFGTALWPERYDGEKLVRIREVIGSRAWASLYQQSPKPREGNMFWREWFEIIEALPKGLAYCRFWDTATGSASGSDPDYHAGCLEGRDKEGRTYIADMRRSRDSPADLEALLRYTAASDKIQAGDNGSLRIRMEQEKGASGKLYVDNIQRTVLQSYAFAGVPVTGSKEVRAAPLAAQAEGGHVKVLRAPWNGAFFDELEAFPNGAHCDQVDAASGAYLELAMGATGQTKTIAGPGGIQ
jgi:predicted phage terminase large subunit-like protein